MITFAVELAPKTISYKFKNSHPKLDHSATRKLSNTICMVKYTLAYRTRENPRDVQRAPVKTGKV